MIGSLPPATDAEIIKGLREYCKSLLVLNKKYRDKIEEQKSLIKEMDNFIRDNI